MMRRSRSKEEESKISYETKEKTNVLNTLMKVQIKEQRTISKNLLGPLFGTSANYNQRIEPLRNALAVQDYNTKDRRKNLLLEKVGSYDFIYQKEEKDLIKITEAVSTASDATKQLMERLKLATQFCLGLDEKQTLLNMKATDKDKKKRTVSDAVNISVIRVYLQLIVSAVYDGSFQSKIKASEFFETMSRWKRLDKQAKEIKSQLSKIAPSPKEIEDLKKTPAYNEGKINEKAKKIISSNIDIEAQNAGYVLSPYRDSLMKWTEAITTLNKTLEEKYGYFYENLYSTTLLFVVNKTESDYVKRVPIYKDLELIADENTKLGTLPCLAAVDFINQFYQKIESFHKQVVQVDEEFKKVFTTLEIYMRMDDKATEEFCNSIHMRRKNRTLLRTMKEIYLYFKQRFSRSPKNNLPVKLDPEAVQQIKRNVNIAIEEDRQKRKDAELTSNIEREKLEVDTQLKKEREIAKKTKDIETAVDRDGNSEYDSEEDIQNEASDLQ